MVPQIEGPNVVGAADVEIVSIVRNVRVARYMLKIAYRTDFPNLMNFAPGRL
jgi:hypothetical protein